MTYPIVLAHGVCRFDNGVTGTIKANYRVGGRIHRFEVHGPGVSAYINLDEFPEAVALSERILETHGDQAVVWSYYADALQRSGRLEDAMAALDREMDSYLRT